MSTPTSTVSQPEPNVVLNEVEGNPGRDPFQYAALLSLPVETVRAELLRLRDKGLVRRAPLDQRWFPRA